MLEPLSDKIQNIELTEAGKKPCKSVIFITDSEMAQTIDDHVKIEIIRVLREGINDTQTIEKYDKKTKETVIRQWPVKRYALSVAEIVKQSKLSGVNALSRNQVYHHLPRLIESGFVIKFGTVTKGKRTTDYFRRTAETFVLPESTPAVDEQYIKNRLAKDIVHINRVFGFSLPEEMHQEFIDLGSRLWHMKDEWARLILQNLQEDLVDSRSVLLYDWLLELTALSSQEYVESGRRMWEMLLNRKSE